ncbi:MAG: KUP/HAK/KT family potassium transporter [Alphaproteobacteria bacterium]|nr:KUP/HAK/KT family potassium transporter [Alphaproteobacteria bacterium]
MNDSRGHDTADNLRALSLAALGVVFGDIGTSPLYTFKTVLDVTGPHPDPTTTLGALSLIVWTLIVITSFKYVALAMSVDNEGEGGILALMSVLGVKQRHRPVIVLAGLFGAALIYGDGAITPAISVLSALEGTHVVLPELAPYVLPAAVAILIGLFALQRQGTARIGGLFGPIMALWFVTIGLLGLWGIARHPAVLWALDPLLGLRYLASGGPMAFLLLGGVFLCVTGAEALYADMGHFGRRPIRLAWSALVFPALVLNYAGQAALVLAGAPIDHIFFRLCPDSLRLALVVLATIATIIASQAIVTGAYSMTRQAAQLGFLPRVRVVQTSATGYGQIYVPSVNWLLMLATVGLAIGFGSSSNLAAAYGIAVSGTMMITTLLLFAAMREIWHWRLPAALAVAGLLAVIDLAFVSANMVKVLQGGWVPLAMAAVVYAVMLVWRAGAAAVQAERRSLGGRSDAALRQIVAGKIPRVPGTAVFLARSEVAAPPILIWHLKNNRALHESVLIADVTTASVPYVPRSGPVALRKLAPQVWRCEVQFGFMEPPDIPPLVERLAAEGYPFDPADVTYYMAHEHILPRDDGRGLPRPVEAVFAFLQRNAPPLCEYFRVPRDRVVEIGREFAI